jgi:hypothetical protein
MTAIIDGKEKEQIVGDFCGGTIISYLDKQYPYNS